MSKVKRKKNKKTILVLDNIPLFPVNQGGPSRIYNLFSNITKEFDVNYIGSASHFVKPHRKDRIYEVVFQTSKYGWLNRFLVNFLAQNKKWLRGGSLYDIGLTSYLKLNPRFKRIVEQLVQHSNILIASHPWFFPFIKKYKNKILVYDSHNCEYELLRRKMNNFLLGKILVSLTKRIEGKACKKSDLIIACSDIDKAKLIEYYHINREKIYVIPNTVDTKTIKPVSIKEKLLAKKKLGLSSKKTVLFIAANFFPNNAAADFIIDELAKKMPDFTFLFIGTINVHFERTRGTLPKNVILYGRVPQEELLLTLKATDIAINPVLHGSGICIKTLDYMAAGLPIVSTPRGMRGIPADNNKYAITCDLKEFRTKTRMLYKNKKLQKKLVKNARTIVKKEFDSKVVSSRMGKILEKARKKR